MQPDVYKTRTITPATAARSPLATVWTAPLVWFTDDDVGTLPDAVELGPPNVGEAVSIGTATLLAAAVLLAAASLALALALTAAVELGNRWPAAVVRLTLAHWSTKSL